jgi:HPt (histidine-containing phosphotransfer) domain-containing protein
MPNLTYINKLSKGDEAFSKKLINVIKTEFPEEKNLYHEYLFLKKFTEAASLVHKLRHKMSILSYEKGYLIATQHENNLKEDNNVLEKEFENVLETITNYLTLI